MSKIVGSVQYFQNHDPYARKQFLHPWRNADKLRKWLSRQKISFTTNRINWDCDCFYLLLMCLDKWFDCENCIPQCWQTWFLMAKWTVLLCRFNVLLFTKLFPHVSHFILNSNIVNVWFKCKDCNFTNLDIDFSSIWALPCNATRFREFLNITRIFKFRAKTEVSKT